MHVILDTSAINLDFRLSNRETRLLLERAPSLGLRVCVPEVVVLEMVQHYRSEIVRAMNQIDQAGSILSRLASREVATIFNDQDLHDAIVAYEAEFRDLLGRNDVRVLPLPAAARDVRILLNRDFAKRRPFNAGRGMRDTLLWESVLELCQREPRPIALITKNTKDFADNSNEQFHEHLIDDLRGVGILAGDIGAPGDAEFHGSIGDFIRARVSPETMRRESSPSGDIAPKHNIESEDGET